MPILCGNRFKLLVPVILMAVVFLCVPVFGRGKKKTESSGFYNKALQKRGMQKLYSGDVKGAVSDFCAMLNTDKPSPWTVSVIVLCHEDNVAKTVHRARGTGPLFVIPVMVKEKPCFRVCAGLYSNRKVASAHVGNTMLEGIETKPFPLLVECKELAKLTTREGGQAEQVDETKESKADNAGSEEASKDSAAEKEKTTKEEDSSSLKTENSETVAVDGDQARSTNPLKVDVIVPEEKKTEHVDTKEEKGVALQSKKDTSKEVEGKASKENKTEPVKPAVEEKDVTQDNKTEKKKVKATGNSEGKLKKPDKAEKKKPVLKPYTGKDTKTSLPSREGRSWFNKGLEALGRGDVLTAEEDFNEALRADPGRPEILNDLGIVRLRQGRYAEAEKLFRQALEKSPNYARARLNLSGALWGLGKKAEALAEAEKASKLDPDDVSCFLTLASFYLSEGQTDKAAVAAQRALLLDPGNSRARSLLNKCAEESGRK